MYKSKTKRKSEIYSVLFDNKKKQRLYFVQIYRISCIESFLICITVKVNIYIKICIHDCVYNDNYQNKIFNVTTLISSICIYIYLQKS